MRPAVWEISESLVPNRLVEAVKPLRETLFHSPPDTGRHRNSTLGQNWTKKRCQSLYPHSHSWNRDVHNQAETALIVVL